MFYQIVTSDRIAGGPGDWRLPLPVAFSLFTNGKPEPALLLVGDRHVISFADSLGPGDGLAPAYEESFTAGLVCSFAVMPRLAALEVDRRAGERVTSASGSDWQAWVQGMARVSPWRWLVKLNPRELLKSSVAGPNRIL